MTTALDAAAAERDAALAREAALLEVLHAINASRGDLAPVFDAMLERAMHLCGATLGSLFVLDGDAFRSAAQRGVPAAYAALRAGTPLHRRHGTPLSRALASRQTVHVLDLAADDGYLSSGDHALLHVAGARTAAIVPCLKDHAVLGFISIYRQEVSAFSPGQLRLLENFAAQAVIAMENARLITEQREALEQQTATAEVLQVINVSPGNLAPVFDAMLEKAMRLCDAAFGLLATYDGKSFVSTAWRGIPPAFQEFVSRPIPLEEEHPESAFRQVLGGTDVIHQPDIADDEVYRSGIGSRRELVDLGGARTRVMVALRHHGVLLGIINIYRTEVRPFSDKQIALLQGFAAQAVIAMENARLLNEQREALERQTATAEVLGVINANPGNLVPVFDAILEKAHSICGASKGALNTFDGEHQRSVATRGISAAFQRILREPRARVSGSPLDRLMNGESIYQIADCSTDTHPVARAAAALEGIHTILFVPLRRDAALLGMITAYRQEVRPFSDRQIALLQNFAAQAVIAMENARLLTEQREALEQQTATAEVLQVINASAGDLAPVFDAMLERAMRLCDAAFGSLYTYDGERFQSAAQRGVPAAYAAFRHRTPPTPVPGGTFAQAVETKRALQVPDLTLEKPYLDGNPNTRAMVELGGVRTILTVPLCRDAAVVGLITVFRQEVRAFTAKQIALIEAFAAQAVIAMDNARLITDQREALERQTATADVLQVINRFPGEIRPVFDIILEKAHALCGAAVGSLLTYDGAFLHAQAAHGFPESVAAIVRHPIRISARHRALMQGERFVHVADLGAVALQPDQDVARAVLQFTTMRSMLLVPLRKDGAFVGQITAFREGVHPFAEKEIVLLESFAAQAVIAMDNARLLIEQREALEQQKATAEVLQVINASPGDLAPVFDAILEKAHNLCNAAMGALVLYDGEYFRAVASHGFPQQHAELIRQPYRPNRHHLPLFGGERFIHVRDIRGAETSDHEVFRNLVRNTAARTLLIVPLRKDGQLLGNITAYRLEVRTFSDKEIALLEGFAAQAVIAMENARLLGELRQRTSDVQASLEYQMATSDVLKVISQSTFDLEPVFQTVTATAVRLCHADQAGIYLNGNGEYRWAGGYSQLPEYERIEREVRIRPGTGTLVGRVALEGRPVHIVDVWSDALYEAKEDAHVGAIHTLLGVPMLRDGELMGVVGLARTKVEPFTERQIELVTTFADQAVIAIENARLLTEQREALEQQKATAEVLQVINTSPGELAPVFDAILEKAHNLCGSAVGSLAVFDGRNFRRVATQGIPRQHASLSSGPFAPTVLSQPLIEGARLNHVLDVRAIDIPEHDAMTRDLAERTEVRTALLVPLRGDGDLLGYISAFRHEVRRFSEKEIALLENFAVQAVIAIENARLLTEQRDALERQTATAEVLGVINASPGDLAPVFDAILEKAHSLCGAVIGSLLIYDGEHFHAEATHGQPEQIAAILRKPFRPNVFLQKLLLGEHLVHIPDFKAAATDADHALTRGTRDDTAIRTSLWVPLRKDGTLLGCISAFRLEVRPFSEKEIALLENFASQAVIAMENARLLDEVRQRQFELRATFENMGDGVAMFDATLRLVAWNGKFQEIFDFPADLLERNATYEEHLRYLAQRGDLGADAEEQIRRLTDSVSRHHAYERTRPDGRVIEIRHNPVPAGGFVLIFSDITERKRNEAEIRDARDAAETAYRQLKATQANLIQAEKMASLGQLTAGIAHEIKNPLNFVNNFSLLSVELLNELRQVVTPMLPSLDEARRAEVLDVVGMLTGNLEKITEHGQRADGIVRAMLDHSRGGSGDRRSVDLNTLVEEALNLVYHGARAQDQGFNIALQRDLGAGIPSIELVPQDVTRVLLNLFSNGFYAARQRQRNGASPGFEPMLKVATRDLGDAVEIRVRDNGIGIPDADRDKLFQPFFTTKPTGEGTGLGLSISYDIITQRHGGSITVDSQAGEYSEFTIRLPRER